MEKDKLVSKIKTSSFLAKISNIFLLNRKRKIMTVVIILLLVLAGWKLTSSNQKQLQYQTATVQKGTLVTSVSESGSVAVANRTNISTKASGVINEVNVKDGDPVTAGEKIASLTLDLDGQQRQTQALAAYLSAKNTLDNANAKLYSLQSTMFTDWQAFTDLSENSTYQNPDGSPNTTNRTLPQFTTVQDNWLAAEADYKNQQGAIAADQTALNSTWNSYQSASAVITSPTTGTISDLTIVPGMQLNNTTGTTNSSGNVSSQVIASIKTEGNPVINVSLSEVDVASVKPEDKATVTFDALPNQSFTGKVIGINTTGVVTSGVTTYPTVIELDIPNDAILPNMSATANIITHVKNDVLLIPSAAIQTNNGSSTVRVLKNGQLDSVPVTTGLASDTQTEIISGLSEGDTVVTNVLNTTTAVNNNSTSPFSGTLRFGGGGFGGRARGGAGRGG